MRPQKVLLLLSCLLLLASGKLVATERVTVSWRTSAPDMSDVRDFNDSGSSSVPVKSNCGNTYVLVRIHTFDSFRGSTRGSDHNPMRGRSVGIALTVHLTPGANKVLQDITVESGQGDWHNSMRLIVPIYSQDQLEELGPELTWVIPREDFMLPKFWNQVALNCD